LTGRDEFPHVNRVVAGGYSPAGPARRL